MSAEMIKGGTARIASFGTHNPKVAAFLNASFALEGLGSLKEVAGIQMQNIGNQVRSNDIGLA